MAALRADAGNAARDRASTGEAASPTAIAQIRALVPSSTADDSSHALLLAALGLFALLCASGSFISVASRIWRGQLR